MPQPPANSLSPPRRSGYNKRWDSEVLFRSGSTEMADELPPLGVPTPGPPPAPPPPPPSPLWAPATQGTLAMLAGLVLILVGWRGYGLSRWSTRPAPVEQDAALLAPMDLNGASETE